MTEGTGGGLARVLSTAYNSGNTVNIFKEEASMKLTEKFKEATRKGTECIKRHAPELAVGSLILLAAGTIYVVHKDKQKQELLIRKLTETGAEILKGWTHGGGGVIKGTGPLWEALKGVFEDIEMGSEDVWMVEADDNGSKLITHFGPDNITEELEI